MTRGGKPQPDQKQAGHVPDRGRRPPQPPKPGKAKTKTIPKGRMRQGRSRS